MPFLTAHFAQTFAVQGLEVLEHEIGVDVAARIGHFGQRFGASRHHQHARARRDQNHAARASRMLHGKMLRDAAAPADAHHVDHIDV